jgi:hypothetical protein
MVTVNRGGRRAGMARREGFVLAAVVALLAVCAVVSLGGPGRGDLAESSCVSWVREHIQAPAARFPVLQRVSGGHGWTVYGTVHTDQPDGGVLSRSFSCVTEWQRAGFFTLRGIYGLG